MPDPIPERLASLPKLSTTVLRDLWKQAFKAVPPCQLRKNLMIPILACRIQELAFGSLRPDTHRRLRQLARAFEADPKAGIPSAPGIKPGTRLVRQWRNQTHVVHVSEEGFEYRDSRYKSLSEIARLITGTRWSGPLFFGVKAKQSKKSMEAE